MVDDELVQLRVWKLAATPLVEAIARQRRYDDCGLTWCSMHCAVIVAGCDEELHAPDCPIVLAHRLLDLPLGDIVVAGEDEASFAELLADDDAKDA